MNDDGGNINDVGHCASPATSLKRHLSVLSSHSMQGLTGSNPLRTSESRNRRRDHGTRVSSQERNLHLSVEHPHNSRFEPPSPPKQQRQGNPRPGRKDASYCVTAQRTAHPKAACTCDLCPIGEGHFCSPLPHVTPTRCSTRPAARASGREAVVVLPRGVGVAMSSRFGPAQRMGEGCCYIEQVDTFGLRLDDNHVPG